jgi:hypothetical protein
VSVCDVLRCNAASPLQEKQKPLVLDSSGTACLIAVGLGSPEQDPPEVLAECMQPARRPLIVSCGCSLCAFEASQRFADLALGPGH